MAYRVRRSEGELTLASGEEVVKAWKAGLIRATDQIFSDDTEVSVPAGEFPGIKPLGIRVRTAEGELAFESLYDVDKAWKVGLVDPEDEIIEGSREGSIKAKDHPNLTRGEPDRSFFGAGHPIRVGLIVAFGIAAMIAYRNGKFTLALGLAFLVAAQMGLLTWLATRPKVLGH